MMPNRHATRRADHNDSVNGRPNLKANSIEKNNRRLRDRTRKLLGLFVATNFVVPKLIDWAVARIKEGETVDNNNNKGAKKWIGRTLETVAMPLFKTAWFYFNTIQLNGDIRREIDELRDACHLPKSSVSDNSSDIID